MVYGVTLREWREIQFDPQSTLYRQPDKSFPLGSLCGLVAAAVYYNMLRLQPAREQFLLDGTTHFTL